MKKLLVLAVLGLVHAASALAQSNMDVYESDRRYCASGRSGMNFNSCMRRLQYDREQRYRDYRGRPDDWAEPQQPRWQAPPPSSGWGEPPPRQYQQPVPEKPRLSDMQQRALDNCALLAPREQPRCRATVFSTVR
jgi:hypothetical protein